MKFSELTGHRQTIESLRGLADSGRIPHAILLSGKPGIGKMKIARTFAQYIHCRNPKEGEPCGECDSCIQHKNLNNPDLHFVYPIVKKDGALISKDVVAQWREFITSNPYLLPEKWNLFLKAGNSQPAIYVSESDAVIERASLSSFQENYKIFIVWLPEKMRVEAANKLLKIIEEPFEDTIFILVSNDPNKLLPTILSRVQRYTLSPLTTDQISEYLIRERDLPSNAAFSVARLAEGSIALAEEIATQSKERAEFTSAFIEMMRRCYGLQGKKMKEISETLAAFGREKIIRFLEYASRLVRENFIYNLSIRDLNLLSSEEEEFSKKFSPFIHENNVAELDSEISKAVGDIERNANSKIVMFDLMFNLSRLLRLPKP